MKLWSTLELSQSFEKTNSQFRMFCTPKLFSRFLPLLPQKEKRKEKNRKDLTNFFFSFSFSQQNQSKAEKASAAELESSFGTADEMECAREICKKGDLQLTAAERAEKVAQKRAAILNYLNKYYMDPKSNLPHPIARLDAALDDIKVFIFFFF